jgi:hypothetical protein
MLVTNLIKPTGAIAGSLQMRSENGGHQSNIYTKNNKAMTKFESNIL